MAKIQAKIEVTFLMDFTPDSKGKLSSKIKFNVPEYPDLKLTDELKKRALDQVGMLCHAMLTHPDGFPA